MHDKRNVQAAGERAVGAVLLCIGLATFGVLVFGASKLASARALDLGDVVTLSVFAIFGSFCAVLGGRLLRHSPTSAMQARPSALPSVEAPAPRRTGLSRACAAAGVLLLVLSVLVPAHWHPVVLLFVGLALLAVSHALTPCVERLEQLRRARASMRQL